MSLSFIWPNLINKAEVLRLGGADVKIAFLELIDNNIGPKGAQWIYRSNDRHGCVLFAYFFVCFDLWILCVCYVFIAVRSCSTGSFFVSRYSTTELCIQRNANEPILYCSCTGQNLSLLTLNLDYNGSLGSDGKNKTENPYVCRMADNDSIYRCQRPVSWAQNKLHTEAAPSVLYSDDVRSRSSAIGSPIGNSFLSSVVKMG